MEIEATLDGVVEGVDNASYNSNYDSVVAK